MKINKFKYMIGSLVVSIGFFVALHLNSIEDAESKVAKSVSPRIEKVAVVVPETTVEAGHSEVSGSTLPESKDEHDEHGSEFYTEMMPYKAKVSTPVDFSQPQTDDAKLGFILDAEYVPAYDKTGNFSGLKVSSLPLEIKESLLKIKNGDVVKNINGIELVNEESFGAAIEQILMKGEIESVITFDVERNGELYSISLAIKP